MKNKVKNGDTKKVEYTTRTLWTATRDAGSVDDQAPQVTPAMKAKFQDSLKQSKSAIEKKIEAFEPAPLSKAAAYTFR